MANGARWQLWTVSQRRTLVVFLLLLAVLLGWRGWRWRLYLPDPAGQGSRAGELPGRLDPNFASADALSALPGLGPSRAQAIIGYRQQFLRDHPDEFPFRQPDDLQNVPGLGPVTVEGLVPYLLFPAETP